MSGLDRGAAAALLEWWGEAGVDVAVRDDAPAWLDVQSLTRKAPPKPQAKVEVKAARLPDSPGDVAAFLELRSATMKARHVAALGPTSAPLMILGDRPGREAAAEGKPFGGEAGMLLTRMLRAIGLERDACARALLEPAHRPGEKIEADRIEELSALARLQLRHFQPEKLLLFGDASARALLGVPLMEARGKVHRVEGIRTVATFHPRWLLKRPQDKAKSWADLLLLMAEEE